MKVPVKVKFSGDKYSWTVENIYDGYWFCTRRTFFGTEYYTIYDSWKKTKGIVGVTFESRPECYKYDVLYAVSDGKAELTNNRAVDSVRVLKWEEMDRV